MKKASFIIAMSIMALVSNAASDTVTVIEQPSQVIITETPNGVKVNVVGSKDDKASNYYYSVEHAANDKVTTKQSKDWDVRYPFSDKDSTSHWSVVTDGFYMGAGISHSLDYINNSFEIGLLNIVGLNYDSHHGQQISLGVGIHHKSYSFKRPFMLERNDSIGIIEIGRYPDGVREKHRSSNLNQWALQFPLMFRQKIHKSLALKVGGIMKWNFKTHVNNHFEIDNTEYDITVKGIKQRKVTFDAIFGLTFGESGFYCRYSPNEVLKKGCGPVIKDNWSLGICIGF